MSSWGLNEWEVLFQALVYAPLTCAGGSSQRQGPGQGWPEQAAEPWVASSSWLFLCVSTLLPVCVDLWKTMPIWLIGPVEWHTVRQRPGPPYHLQGTGGTSCTPPLPSPLNLSSLPGQVADLCATGRTLGSFLILVKK